MQAAIPESAIERVLTDIGASFNQKIAPSAKLRKVSGKRA
jgi:hypothetical protein